jgi:uncharacterized protein (DUF58 family)
MNLALRDRIGDWIFPPKGPENGPVVLGQRRVYILPTVAGLWFGVTLLLMLVGAINYNLSLGYILTFLLAGMGVVSILHTWRNLARLSLRPGKSQAVFTGDTARFHVVVENAGTLPRMSLAIQLRDRSPVYVDVPATRSIDIELALPAERRGLLSPGRLRIFTTYPLGLFHAWALVDLDMQCLVYPRPEPGIVPPPPAQPTRGEGPAAGDGEEDFSGLRNYHAGDSPRRIAWKAVARNEVFLTKTFTGSAATRLWLDLGDTPEALGLEARLSRLTRWVVDAESAGHQFGLRLAGIELGPGAGASQRDQCLRALALFDARPRTP